MSELAITHDADAVPWMNFERELRQEQPRQWAARLRNIRGNQFDQIMIILSRFATNTEINRLFQFFEKLDEFDQNRLQHWKNKFLSLSPSIFTSRTRYKAESFYANDYWLTHYKLAAKDDKSKIKSSTNTIIALTGSAGLLMAPIPCVLASLSQKPRDLIVIRRACRTSYFDGANRLLRSIAQHLHSRLRNNLFRSTLLGTSSGGLAALSLARVLNVPLGIAIGAGVSSNENLINSGAINTYSLGVRKPMQLSSFFGIRTRLLLAASAENPIDKSNAYSITNYFNSVWRGNVMATSLFFPDCQGHCLPEDLSRNGITLDKLLMPLLDNSLIDLPQHQRFP